MDLLFITAYWGTFNLDYNGNFILLHKHLMRCILVQHQTSLHSERPLLLLQQSEENYYFLEGFVL